MTAPTSSRPAPPVRGAIVSVDPTSGATTAIPFQFNPGSLTRTLRPQTVGGGPGERSDAVLFTGAPVETIQAEVELDAVDLSASSPAPTGISATLGVAPSLAALELLAYPSTQAVQQNMSSLASGSLEVGPYVAPLTLLVWGAFRVVPVTIVQLTVTEQEFDPALNPVRARVTLELRVLSYSDLASGSRGYTLFMAYQQAKEKLGALGLLQGSAAIQGATGASV